MKVLFSIASILFALSAQANVSEEKGKPVFECVNADTLQISNECISEKIEVSDAFQLAQKSMYEQAEARAENAVMSTITMDPKTLSIMVVAQVN